MRYYLSILKCLILFVLIGCTNKHSLLLNSRMILKKLFGRRPVTYNLYILIFACCLSFNSFAELTKVTLHIPGQSSYRFAGYIAAIEKGYYQAVGIEVKLKIISENTKGYPSASSIEEPPHFVVGSTQLLLDNNKGSSYVVLANFLQKNIFIFLTSKNTDITSFFNIGNAPISFGEPNAQGMFSSQLIQASVALKAVGIDARGLNNQPASWDEKALVEKKTWLIPSLLTTGPYFLERQMIEPRIIKAEEYGLSLYDDVLYSNRQFIVNNPKLVADFIDATIKGWHFSLAYPQDLIAILLSKYQSVDSVFDKDFLNQEALIIEQLIQHELVEIGHVNVEKWQKIARLFYELKLIEDQNIDVAMYLHKIPEREHRIISVTNITITYAVLLSIFCGYFYYDKKKYKKVILQQKSEGKRLRKFAETDSLTALDNRHKLNITLDELHQEVVNLKIEYCLIIIDIDKFKEFNDLYGHLAGDAVLVSLAKRTEQILRVYDSFARFGGEEFVITLPNTSRAIGLTIAHRILEANRKNQVHYDTEILSYTVSIGVASSHPTDKTSLDILARADKYLYQAKDKGRDRVCSFDSYQQPKDQ